MMITTFYFNKLFGSFMSKHSTLCLYDLSFNARTFISWPTFPLEEGLTYWNSHKDSGFTEVSLLDNSLNWFRGDIANFKTINIHLLLATLIFSIEIILPHDFPSHFGQTNIQFYTFRALNSILFLNSLSMLMIKSHFLKL